MFSLVLAAVDLGQVVWLCVVVISIISWIIKQVQGVAPDARNKPQQGKPKQGRSEIEVLLEQLGVEKKKPKAERREPPKPPRTQAPLEKGKAKSKPTPQRTGSASSLAGPRPGQRVAETHLATSQVGSELRSQRMPNRVEAEVQRDITSAVQRDIQVAVERDFSGQMTPEIMRSTQEKAVHPLVKVLRDPNGMRQAVLLNEILQRPKSVRR
jgi:hypothetical protein